MRIYVGLLLLIACAVVLPGGLVLLPLACAKYRKLSKRVPLGVTLDVPAG